MDACLIRFTNTNSRITNTTTGTMATTTMASTTWSESGHRASPSKRLSSRTGIRGKQTQPHSGPGWLPRKSWKRSVRLLHYGSRRDASYRRGPTSSADDAIGDGGGELPQSCFLYRWTSIGFAGQYYRICTIYFWKYNWWKVSTLNINLIGNDFINARW